MNTMNDLEKHLRSWTPRAPSVRIERTVFHRDLPSRHHPALFHPSWMLPVSAACLLLFAVMRPPGDAAFPSLPGPIVAVIMSNQTAAAYLSTAYQPQANGVPVETFEWTNDRTLTSSIPSISTRKGSYKTNEQ